MKYLDIFFIGICLIIPLLSIMRGYIKEAASVIYYILLYTIGVKIIDLTGLLKGSIILLIAYIVFFIITRIIDNIYRKKDDFSSFRYHLYGIFPGLLKLFFVMVIFISIFETVYILKPDFPEYNSEFISIFKKYTGFIDYTKLADSMIANTLGSDSIASHGKTENSEKEKSIQNIDQVHKELQKNSAYQELVKSDEVKAIFKNIDVKNPSDIIKVMSNPEIRKFLSSPETKEMLKNTNIRKLLENLRENTETQKKD